MKIDRDLNIVMRLNDEDGNPIIVHSTPINESVFEANWKIFREAYDDLATSKSIASAVVLAKRIFLDSGEKLNRMNDAKEVLYSIAGATFVYKTKAQLLEQAEISNEMKEEVLSRLIFFICYRRHMFPSMMKDWLTTTQLALNLELTSQPAMELFNSSTISTTEESTGKRKQSLPV